MTASIRILAIALLFLFTTMMTAKAAPDSQLNWGMLSSWEKTGLPSPIPAALSHVLNAAQQSLDIEVRPVAAFHLESTLDKDPLNQESNRAKANFPKILDLAICARTAPNPLRSQCLTKVMAALLAWAHTYQPSGNPINEGFFMPIFEAIDLIVPVAAPDDSRTLLDWIGMFATAGDQFYAQHIPSEGRPPATNNLRVNNWMARRLCIRAITGVMRQDRASQLETRSMLIEFSHYNFITGPDGTIDGRTYDFVQRDAIHYHIWDIEPLVWMTLFTPAVVDPQTHDLIDRSLNLLKPYYTGEKQHVEFQNTTVSFDRKRIKEDVNSKVFQIKDWDPKEARNLFFLAREVFPDIQPWTANVVDEHYDPSLKFLVSIYGGTSNVGGE